MDSKTLAALKREARENMSPYFDDEDIEYYYDKNGGDFKMTVYELLIVKSEDSTISVSGLTTQDTSAYFRRLASRFRDYHSGVLDSG